MQNCCSTELLVHGRCQKKKKRKASRIIMNQLCGNKKIHIHLTGRPKLGLQHYCLGFMPDHKKVVLQNCCFPNILASVYNTLPWHSIPQCNSCCSAISNNWNNVITLLTDQGAGVPRPACAAREQVSLEGLKARKSPPCRAQHLQLHEKPHLELQKQLPVAVVHCVALYVLQLLQN